MKRTVMASALALGASASASGAFVGGGFVSLQSWNDAAHVTVGAYLGQPVTVYRLYALFGRTSPTEDRVGSVGNVWLQSKHEIINLTSRLHDSADPFEKPIVRWDSFVTMNTEDLQDGRAAVFAIGSATLLRRRRR